MYVPTMIAADMVRTVVAGRLGDDDDDSLFGTFTNATRRGGILGNLTFMLDINQDLDYSTVPINTLLGPVADSSFKLTRAAFNPDIEFTRAAGRLLQFSAILRGWVTKIRRWVN